MFIKKCLKELGLTKSLFSFFIPLIIVQIILLSYNANTKADMAILLTSPPVEIIDTTLVGQTDNKLQVEIRAIRHRDCELNAFHEWEIPGKKLLVTPNDRKVTLETGKPFVFIINAKYPASFETGKYRWRATAEYHCPERFHIVRSKWIDFVIDR